MMGQVTGTSVVVAPDSFKETATAAAVAGAVGDAVERSLGVVVDRCPLSDGGEGFVDVLGVLGGRRRRATVAGPLGRPVRATWRLVGDRALLEAASACGLALVGGPAANRPLEASTRGVADLLAAAAAAGAGRVTLGVGGTATTDGGLGCVDRLQELGLTGWVAGRVVVACDVTTAYPDAADVFGPQKGAGPDDVVVLRRRLGSVAAELRRRTGRDVVALPGSGAGGGLAGGLAALGAELVPGAALVASAVGLGPRLARAAVAVTGEGRLDAGSMAGKVVGTVLDLAAAAGVPVVVVAGSVAAHPAHPALAAVVDLTARCGRARAWADPLGCAAGAVPDVVGRIMRRGPGRHGAGGTRRPPGGW